MSGDFQSCVRVLSRGGVVACPTETLFGLLADALNPEAVARVSYIKGRRTEDPIAVLAPSVPMAFQLASELPEVATELAELYWPGPLTLVLRAVSGLPAPLLRDAKIGVRVPGPSPALELVRAFGGPLTATSANRTGQQPAVDAEQIVAEFGDEVDAVVPGRAPGGLPSTVVDPTQKPVRVVRAGAIQLDVRFVERRSS